MESLNQDLRIVFRQLCAHPGFVTIVIATIALSIGIATTVFSFFDAVVLRPFPYIHPERLVRVRTFEPKVKNSTHDASVYDFLDWQRDSRCFERMTAYLSFANQLTGKGPAQSVKMTFCSSGFFETFGVQPVAGRTFQPAEDQIGGAVHKVVLSRALATELFGERASAGLDQVLHIGGEAYSVIGVMPDSFAYPERTECRCP